MNQAEALKKSLELNYMTQAELSLRTRISKKHISEMVTWKKRITERVSMTLHYVFGVEEFYFSRLDFK